MPPEKTARPGSPGFLPALLAALPRDRLFGLFFSLALAQLLVALTVRHLLWPEASYLTVLRTFAYFDLVVIAAFAIGGLGLAALGWKCPAARLPVTALGWIFALLHIALLVINLTAVVWLRVPLTWDWLALADLTGGTTTIAMLSVMTTGGKIAGMVLALLLPVALWLVLRLGPVAPLVASPLALGGLALFAAATPLSATPPQRDQWRDAVSSPLVEMARSMTADYSALLHQAPGDGQTADYVLRPARPAPAGSTDRPDILLIVLESVRWKVVRDNWDTLPTLAALRDRGTLFPNSSVTVPGSSRSMFQLMFSRYPRFAVDAESRYAPPDLPPPITRPFKDNGYTTLFAQGGDFAYHGWDQFLSGAGSGPLLDGKDIPCSRKFDRSTQKTAHNFYIADRCTLSAIGDWFAATPGPRFAIMWPVGNHFPYDYNLEQTSVAHPQASYAAYRASLQVLDRELGLLLGRMAAGGVDPVVIVTGDHGQQFGEHGSVMHDRSVFEVEVAVPMIVAGPGVPQQVVDDRLVQLQDIGPTLVAIAGIGQPEGWQGLSMLGPDRRQRSFHFSLGRDPVVGMRVRDRKYHFDLRREEMRRFDLGHDPAEMDGAVVTGSEAAGVRAAMAQWVQFNEALFNRAAAD